MKLNVITIRKSINKAFLKVKPNRTQIEDFKKNILGLYGQINESESQLPCVCNAWRRNNGTLAAKK